MQDVGRYIDADHGTRKDNFIIAYASHVHAFHYTIMDLLFVPSNIREEGYIKVKRYVLKIFM